MEPKSVNTTVSSVLQIAAGPTSPDGAESSALDFAQVILASQGNSGAGEEQQQGRNGSNGVEDTNHKLSADDTLTVSGDPLALKIFRRGDRGIHIRPFLSESPRQFMPIENPCVGGSISPLGTLKNLL